MQLGFVSAILPDCSLEDVFQTAQQHGFDCVELMCWPVGKADRRYAGVTHIDVDNLNGTEIERINNLTRKYGVAISALGYYPNPLEADEGTREIAVNHLFKVISAAQLLGLQVVNTFIGRDKTKLVEEQWDILKK
ncbi:MAG TPA: TIM barrel protein, partial [Gemmatales bacterium]|nr:TIM barrel protein [Gemmatales bacterium]